MRFSRPFAGWLWGLALLASLQGWARDPESTPILRLDTPMHTSLIRRLAVDGSGQRLVSIADDKTLRLWALPGLVPLRTLRVPLGAGHEGQLFGLALSPDGRFAAVGGWTGWEWEGRASVYVFDLRAGELVRRLGGLPDAVSALAWSPDGRHLAVGLQGRAGLRVLRVADWQEVAADAAFADKVMDLDFHPSGLLAAVSLDGMTRVYDRAFQPLLRRALAPGQQPAAVRIAPDGRQVAVGHVGAPLVAVLDLRAPSAAPRLLRPAAAGASLLAVAWSADGGRLYAAGEAAPGQGSIQRWAADGAPLAPVPLAAGTVNDLVALPRGGVAWGAQDPAIGLLAADDRPSPPRGPDFLDFSINPHALLVSADGAAVRFASTLGAREFRLAEGPVSPLQPPVLRGPALALSGLEGGSLRLNGVPLALDDYERVRAHALAADGGHVLLGTSWALRLFDPRGRERWVARLAAEARAVNLSRDGRVAVASLSDGTVRWYRVRDGQELLAYLPLRNGQDWIAWVPAGYYMCSPEGDNFVGWQLNRGLDRAPDFYRAVQFERLLYRPDLVRRALAEPAGRPEAGGFDIARLADIAPPRLAVTELGVRGVPGYRPRARLRLKVEGARAGEEVTVFVNGLPVTPGAARRGLARGGELEVELPAQENLIRVEAFNGQSLGLAETRIALARAPDKPGEPGDLYVLAIGANQFPRLGPDVQLAFAVRDATAVAGRFEQLALGQYRQVLTRVLADDGPAPPGRAQVLEAVRFVQAARAADTVVVFLASHGISDPAGNYYFVPRDGEAADFHAVSRGEVPASFISWQVFFDALRAAAGRRILIVDTCQARNIQGRFDAFALQKRSAASRFALVVAAQGDEDSQEYAPAEHGLFTHALLSAMGRGADRDGDGRLSLREIFDSARPVVDALRDRSIGPQTPQLLAPPELEHAPLLPAR